MPRRRLLGIAAAALALTILVLVGLFWYRARNAPLLIGGVISLTGAAFYLGGEVRDGAQMAIDEVNAWGGLNGRKLQLVVEDSKSDPATGKKAFQHIEGKYHPLFYLSTSSTVSVALVPQAEAAQCVLVGLVVTSPLFPGKSPWAFRYYPTAENDIMPIVPILKMLKIRRMGALHLNDEFGSAILQVLQREMGKLGGEVFSVQYPASTQDFEPFFQKLRGYEGIYLNGFIPNLETIYSHLSRHPVSETLFSNNASIIPRVRVLPMTNGVYASAPIMYNEHFAFAVEARRKYENRYNKPFNHYAANGYDFLKLITGLLEGKKVSRQLVKAILEEGFRYPGILGEISVEPGVHGMSFPLYPAQIVNGQVDYLNLDFPAPLSSSRGPTKDGQ